MIRAVPIKRECVAFMSELCPKFINLQHETRNIAASNSGYSCDKNYRKH